MRSSLPLICILLLQFAVNDASARDNQSQGTQALDKIRWILGDWVQTGGQTTTRETWIEIDRIVFKGAGITTDSATGAKQSEESLLLTEMSGRIYFFAKVDHNKYPVPFELTSSSATEAVFENADHDFPKKFEYRLDEMDALNVIVSDGGARSFTIGFKRVPAVEAKNE